MGEGGGKTSLPGGPSKALTRDGAEGWDQARAPLLHSGSRQRTTCSPGLPPPPPRAPCCRPSDRACPEAPAPSPQPHPAGSAPSMLQRRSWKLAELPLLCQNPTFHARARQARQCEVMATLIMRPQGRGRVTGGRQRKGEGQLPEPHGNGHKTPSNHHPRHLGREGQEHRLTEGMDGAGGAGEQRERVRGRQKETERTHAEGGERWAPLPRRMLRASKGGCNEQGKIPFLPQPRSSLRNFR